MRQFPYPPDTPSAVTDKSQLGTFTPTTTTSERWKYWSAIFDERTCLYCYEHGNKIYASNHLPEKLPDVHDSCRCVLNPLQSLIAGTASHELMNGANFWIVHYGQLPPYYRSSTELMTVGWRYGDKPSRYMPGSMYTNGVYLNHNKKLPDAPNRIWYEADLNYYHGKRNGHRIVWSNDGLIFVTYDHYNTFIEVK